MLEYIAPLQIEIFVEIFPPPLHTITPLINASAIVTRLPLAPARRNDSILFLLNTRSSSLVVQMNLLQISNNELPSRLQSPFIDCDCQVAFPLASLVRIYPEVAPDEIRMFWNAPVPATWSL